MPRVSASARDRACRALERLMERFGVGHSSSVPGGSFFVEVGHILGRPIGRVDRRSSRSLVVSCRSGVRCPALRALSFK